MHWVHSLINDIDNAQIIDLYNRGLKRRCNFCEWIFWCSMETGKCILCHLLCVLQLSVERSFSCIFSIAMQTKICLCYFLPYKQSHNVTCWRNTVFRRPWSLPCAPLKTYWDTLYSEIGTVAENGQILNVTNSERYTNSFR